MAVRPVGTNPDVLVDLTDDELREVILCDWVQLTSVLSHEQPTRLVSRLLRLELERGTEARGTFVERLRGALMRARSRDSMSARINIVANLVNGKPIGYANLQQIGLEEYDIAKLQEHHQPTRIR